MARVQVINETTLNDAPAADEWTLWFQWCRYLYDAGDSEYGYRFIWKRPQTEGGSLQAARGQARVPSTAMIDRLVARARAEGWGDHDADAPQGANCFLCGASATRSDTDAGRAVRFYCNGKCRRFVVSRDAMAKIEGENSKAQWTQEAAKPGRDENSVLEIYREGQQIKARWLTKADTIWNAHW